MKTNFMGKSHKKHRNEMKSNEAKSINSRTFNKWPQMPNKLICLCSIFFSHQTETFNEIIKYPFTIDY